MVIWKSTWYNASHISDFLKGVKGLWTNIKPVLTECSLLFFKNPIFTDMFSGRWAFKAVLTILQFSRNDADIISEYLASYQL